MIGTKRVLDTLAEEFATLELQPDACLRQARLERGQLNCGSCLGVCPHRAIELDPLSVAAERCDGCGACAEACPTEALEHTSSFHRDLFVALSRVDEAQPFRVACPLADSPGPGPVWGVACVAGAPWEAPVVALLRGAATVEVHTGDCLSCARRALRSRVEERVDAVSRMAAALGLGPVTRVLPGQGEQRDSDAERLDPGRDRRLSRRGLFDGILRRGKKVVQRAGASGVERLVRVADPGEERKETTDPRWLRRLLCGLAGGRLREARALALPGAATPEVDGETCAPCPMCEAACPTGALRFEQDTEGDRLLRLEADGCDGCGACVSACPQGSIQLSPLADLSSWGQQLTLVVGRAEGCRRCGEPALSAELPYCSRCYREGHAVVSGA